MFIVVALAAPTHMLPVSLGIPRRILQGVLSISH